MEKENASTASYSKEAYELNNLIIKIKKEILNGTITTLTIDEIDEATIPALNVLRKLKPTHKIY